MPPSSTAPLREPASRRTAECPSFCQGEASWARASTANELTSSVAAKASVARRGTMAFMRRLYRLEVTRTIELLVSTLLRNLGCKNLVLVMAVSLIDRTVTQYQD